MTRPLELEEDIKAFIGERVSQHWVNTDKAYLLSRLGFEIKKSFPEYTTVIPKGLKNYLREWPLVGEVVYPGIPEKIGLVPLDAELPDDITKLFQPPGENLSKGPVYDDKFWEAFTRPINGKRYICLDLDEKVVVSDQSAPENTVKAWEVTPDDIAVHAPGTPIPDKVKTTHRKIDEWLSRNKIERTHFLKVRATSPRRTVSSTTMLEAMFSRLSQEEQSRVLIPMDILLKLIAVK